MTRRVAIRWRHPRRGVMREVCCTTHEREILAALGTLGIGCSGVEADREERCLRCEHPGRLFRGYADQAERGVAS